MTRLIDPATRALRPKYRPVRILIVEDNVFMRTLFSDVMRAIGFMNMQMANDGWEALDIVTRYNPDIVLTDYRMERMDGLELTRMIRRAPDVPNNRVPIVLVTGSTDKELVRAARDAGITEILAKPVSPQGILARIEEALLNPREFVAAANYVGPCRRRRSDKDFVGTRRRKSDGLFRANEESRRLSARIRALWSAADKQQFDPAAVELLLADMAGVAMRSADTPLLKCQKGLVEATRSADPAAVDAALELGLQAALQLLQLGRDRDSDRALVADNVVAMCRHIRQAA